MIWLRRCLQLLRVLQRQVSPEAAQQIQQKTESASIEEVSKRLRRKQGVLVIERSLLKLQTRSDAEDYILSDRLEATGIYESITENGTHYGVKVREKVFDNLSADGLSFEEWISDFHCPSEEFVIEQMETFANQFEKQ